MIHMLSLAALSHRVLYPSFSFLIFQYIFSSKSSFKIRNIHLSFPRHVLFFHPEISLVICFGILRNSGKKNLILILKYYLFPSVFTLLICLFLNSVFFHSPHSCLFFKLSYSPPPPVFSQWGRKSMTAKVGIRKLLGQWRGHRPNVKGVSEI